jgi:drug/metabolite transporter (DMT)-like permease
LIGELSALATAFCWSGSSISFAEASQLVGSVKVNVTRLLLAAVLLGVTLAIFEIPFGVSLSQLAELFISGILGLVLGDSFLFKSYGYLGARVSSLIMSTAPAITAILAFLFLHETLSLSALIGMIITLLGIALVIGGRQTVTKTSPRMTGRGVLYAFLGSCGQAGRLVTAKLAFNQGPIDGLSATFVRIVSALILLLPLSVVTGKIASSSSIFQFERKVFGLTLLGAILGPCLGITFSLIAIAHSKVAVAATIMAIVPIIMLPLVRILYKEILNWRAYAGAVIAVTGVAILFYV